MTNSNRKQHSSLGFYSDLLTPLAKEIVMSFNKHHILLHLRYHFPDESAKDLEKAMTYLRRGGYVKGKKPLRLTHAGIGLKESLRS